MKTYLKNFLNKITHLSTTEKEKIKDIRILLAGVTEARKKLHIFMNVREENLNKLINLLPALKRPTISKLTGEGSEGWFAINSIIEKGI